MTPPDGPSAPPASGAPAGEVGGYRLVRRLGGDALFLAHDPLLDRAVVLRVLAAGGEELALARALARLEHAHLAAVYRVGRVGTTAFLVGEHVRGRPLDDALAASDAEAARALASALADALAALHRAGVAHGAVGRDAVRVTDDDQARLLLPSSPGPATPDAAAADVEALCRLLAPWVPALDPACPRTADELVELLEAASPAPAPGPAAPYRGLLPYGAEHASLFYGRRVEVGHVLDRLRNEAWVVIAGPSGSGKSSLARAGVAPRIAAGALGERPRWRIAALYPGRRPLAALAAALAPAGVVEDVAARLRRDPGAAPRLAEARDEEGVLVLVDQLEELFTQADVDERELFAAALAGFTTLVPGVRLLTTVRADFLGALAGLPALGADAVRAAVPLDPIGAEALREVIVAPARLFGVRFEDDALVETLARGAGAGGLPLLSFVLAELWARRDDTRHVIPAAALTELGGAHGALARHADRVLAALPPAERAASRRILVALVTPAGTRARAAADDLAPPGDAAAVEALAVLVRGRLVIADSTCTLAHEALIDGWPLLRGWLDEEVASRAAAARLRAAAADWERLGRPTEGLWGARQLAELAAPGALELALATPGHGAASAHELARGALGGGGASAPELARGAAGGGGASAPGAPVDAFVAASRAAVARVRRRRLALAAGIPALLALAAAGAWTGLGARETARLGADVAAARVDAARADARAALEEELRAQAHALFSRDEAGAGEALWAQADARHAEADAARFTALRRLDRVLASRPAYAAARALAAELLAARVLAAEAIHDAALASALRAHLARYDEGRVRDLEVPGTLALATAPPGARIAVRRAPGGSGSAAWATADAPAPGTLAWGSYLVEASAPGRAAVVVPVWVPRGARRTIELTLPPAGAIPAGFVVVPGGATRYGSRDPAATRALLEALPEHEIEVPSFLIARRETTACEYSGFLADLPPGERARRGAALAVVPAGADPCTIPVGGVSWDDARAYAAWLAGRVPGARLCTEREWERAARGADGRRYPHGDALAPGDACTLDGAGGGSGGGAPCPVGAHPGSRSPFGINDLVGNVWEWTASPATPGQPELGVLRGGSWAERSDSTHLYTANRGVAPRARAAAVFGLRMCADLPGGG